jgi:hypothetical protein
LAAISPVKATKEPICSNFIERTGIEPVTSGFKASSEPIWALQQVTVQAVRRIGATGEPRT